MGVRTNRFTRFILMDLKKRSDMHWARKIWHMLGVFLLFFVYAFFPYNISLSVIGGLWLFFVPGDYLRLKNPSLNVFALSIFKPIIRDNELNRWAGTSYLLTGVLLLISIYPRKIALLSLLFLAFADPMASYFGIRYGKDKIFGHKSVQGTLAAFVICCLITYGFLFYWNIHMDRIIIISLLSGLIGSLAELIPIGKLDDNLTLPLVSATFLWFIFTIF